MAARYVVVFKLTRRQTQDGRRATDWEHSTDGVQTWIRTRLSKSAPHQSSAPAHPSSGFPGGGLAHWVKSQTNESQVSKVRLVPSLS